jgi:RNase adaptor protein for sRNA GlmZ degradation
MKNLIRHILIEETNKSINLFTNLYDIEENGELIFKSITLPQPYLIPLMNYIGETEDLKEYLKDIHIGEAEKFLKGIDSFFKS